MSVNRLNLKNPIVIAVVCVAMAAVVVMNIRTFGSKRLPKQLRQARVQDHPPMAYDLSQLVRHMPTTNPDQSTGSEPLGRPRLQRDPFGSRRSTTSTALPVLSTNDRPSDGKPVVRGLQCAAVFLGSGAARALVGQRTCRVGDQVGAYVIKEIVAGGVRLRTKDGQTKFLPVGSEAKTSGTFRVETGPRPTRTHGRTHSRTALVIDKTQERNQP